MAFAPTGSGPRSDINITPLVDVVLVLLIIFMVATPILQMGLDVDVPPKITVAAKPDQAPQDQLLVSVRADGFYLDGEKLATTDSLRTALAARLAARAQAERVVFIDAADEVTFDRAVAAMDAVRAAGAERVGFLTEPPG